ncbi:MAG: DUF2279 domain-containing protein [Ignavibacteriae bacterium HGW-Ignavibacteriae-1]|jgi:hypothetical protein|nr:MAG: DUF2279 domain-containing protein [Ignavibacteriae bacterium HGW-Ignavibacteriae-1]
MVNIIKRYFIYTLVCYSLCCQSLKANPENNQVIRDSSQINSKTLYKAIALTSAYYALSMYVLSKTWFKDKEIVPFHIRNDNSGYLQVDKFGHMFGAYFYSYVGYHGLKEMGITESEALLFGGTLGFVMQTPIEIMDGIHQDNGFSWGDIIANSIGSGLVLSQQLLCDEQIIKYKFSYWQSPYSKISNGYLGTNSFNRIFKDYNGHTYWLSFPISKIFPNTSIPKWINFAFGYGAGGMFGEQYNITEYNGVKIPQTERYRKFVVSLDIDWTKIETDSDFLKTILAGLTFIKLPFPTIEYNTKNEIRLHWIYY